MPNSTLLTTNELLTTSAIRCHELLRLYKPKRWGHFVQFYEDAMFVIESVAYLVAKALKVGDSCVLIATGAHLGAIADRVTGYGLDLEKLCAAGRYVALDAKETLSRLMVNGWPDDSKFNQIIGGVIRDATEKSANHFALAFGEMVALLCAENRMEAAVRLEQLWNVLIQKYRFSLCCAYPLSSFVKGSDLDVIFKICAEHSLAIPGEAFSGLSRAASAVDPLNE